MKRAFNGSIWRDDNNNVIAVNLGSDYCAEHEWGIDDIKNELGIPNMKLKTSYPNFPETFKKIKQPIFGIDSRKITKMDKVTMVNNLDKGYPYTYDKVKYTVYGIYMKDNWFYRYEDEVDWKEYIDFYNPGNEELVGKWDEKSFSFMCIDKNVVQDIAEAFNNKDIAIWVGASDVFRNGGLIIAIASRLPEGFVKEMYDIDVDIWDTYTLAAKSGIHKVLENAGKKYYALSPKKNNEGELVFWLNPHEQHKYNSGYYTVKELKQWAKDKGPIIKEKVNS